MDWDRIQQKAKLDFRRAIRGNLQAETAVPAEREILARASKPIEDPLAQDYAAWRRSLLFVATTVLLLSVAAESLAWLEMMVKETTEYARENQLPLRLADEMLGLEKTLATLLFLPFAGGTLLIAFAAKRWTDLRRSRRLARYGWFLIFFSPFVLSLVPFKDFLDLRSVPPEQQQMLSMMIGVALGGLLFTKIATSVIALCSGAIRSSMTLKTLIPESPAPGWTPVLLGPVYGLLLLNIMVPVNQIAGSLLLLCGLAALIASPLYFLLKASDILRPHRPDEIETVLLKHRNRATMIGLGGVLCLIVYALDNTELGVGDLIRLGLGVAGGIAVLTVVGSDFILAMMFRGYRQSQEFHGTELSRDLDRKFASLEAVGLTRLGTHSQTRMMAIQDLGEE